MFELLSGFLQPILDFVPRVSHRPAANEHCVVDGVLGVRETRRPQLHAPILTHVEYFPVNPVAVDLEIQTVATTDDRELTLNATAAIVIDDPITMRLKCGSDSYIGIAAIAMRAEISRIAVSVTEEEFRDMVASDELMQLVSDRLASASFGSLSLDTFAIEDCTRTTSHRVYGISQVL